MPLREPRARRRFSRRGAEPRRFAEIRADDSWMTSGWVVGRTADDKDGEGTRIASLTAW